MTTKDKTQLGGAIFAVVVIAIALTAWNALQSYSAQAVAKQAAWDACMTDTGGTAHDCGVATGNL